MFTIEQLNNVPHLDQYEGNILDTFNFSIEEVQEKLQHLNIYKSTGPDMLHPRILRTLEDKLVGPLTHILNNSLETGIIPEDCMEISQCDCYPQERKQTRTWKLQTH